jgi:hypothetical protein
LITLAKDDGLSSTAQRSSSDQARSSPDRVCSDSPQPGDLASSYYLELTLIGTRRHWMLHVHCTLPIFNEVGYASHPLAQNRS